MLKYLSLIVMIGISFVSAFGQTSEFEKRAEAQRDENSRKQRESIREKQIAEFRKLNHKEILNRKYTPPPSLSKEERKRIKAALAPNPQDLAKYEDFLRQPKTGLFRLMPNLNCSSKYIVSADKDCENSTYAGEYYSFRMDEYSADTFYDITLRDGNLVSGGFLSQGILVNLGDVPIKEVSLNSAGVKFLTDFVPQTDNKAARKQFAEIRKGLEFSGYKYSKSEKALLNATYALRIVAYNTENKLMLNFEEYETTPDKSKFLTSRDDERTDITLAFRIVRQDADGSLSILWKRLDKQEAPKIVFEKDEKLIDIDIN